LDNSFADRALVNQVTTRHSEVRTVCFTDDCANRRGVLVFVAADRKAGDEMPTREFAVGLFSEAKLGGDVTYDNGDTALLDGLGE
jgi:hypothetical protein